jgi:DNA-binding transcriptional LysR family regulator
MKRGNFSAIGDRRVTLEQLRAFVLVVEGRGFQQAAQELHRTQSAVTQSLKRLLEILACRLIERRQGHVIGLTVDGERFLPAATEILARASEAVSAMQQPQLSGRIAIGVPDDFKILDLHGAMSLCASMNRKLRIEVSSALSSDVLHMFEGGQLDLAILKRVATDGYITRSKCTHLLRKEPLHWISNERRSFDDAAELPLVVFPEGCSYRAAALEALTAANKQSYWAYVSASYDNIRAAVSAGLGIGILPQSAIAKDHVLLGAADGFTVLPEVNLVMTQATRKTTVER